MLIHKLHLDYFGRFYDFEIDLHPGMNLIYGDNEAGKSTIHTFIKGMLFGIERARGRASASKEDIYTRYLPWDYPGAYRGYMDIEIDHKRYRIHRSFHTSDKTFIVTNLETGREVKLANDHISDIIPGLTESTYKNTISIEQLKASTDAQLASELRNYMANLSIAKSNEINVAKAINTLTLRKKTLEASLDPAQLLEIKGAIQEGEEKEQQLEALTLQLKKFLTEQEELLKVKQSLMDQMNPEEIKRMEHLPAILEKYRNFLVLTKQCSQFKEKLMELREKKEQIEKKLGSRTSYTEDIKAAQEITTKLQELNLSHQELQQHSKRVGGKMKKSLALTILPFSLIAILAIIITNRKPFGILAGVIFLLAGVLSYSIFTRKAKQIRVYYTSKENELLKKQSDLQEKLSAIYVRHQVASLPELLQKQEESMQLSFALQNNSEQLSTLLQQESETEDQRDSVYEEIMKYMLYFVSEDELTDEAIKRLQDEINHRKQWQLQQQQEINSKLDGIKIEIEKVKWEISTLEENEEELLKKKTRLLELEQIQKENALELEAVKLALNTIQELSISIHDSFGNQLNEAISDTIKKVTNEKYSDIKVNEKLDIKVGFRGSYLPFDKLSTGTMDQIYLSLRLAVSDLLLGKNLMPLIFDDSFAYYDDSRVKASLQQLSMRQQVILFTCHKREQRLLEELQIPYHYVELQ